MEIVNNKTERPLAHYRGLFAQADPEKLAARSCASYSDTTRNFTLMVMGRPFYISWPEGEFLTAPIFMPPQESGDLEGIDAQSTPSVVARNRENLNGVPRGTLTVPEISPELSILLLRILLESTPTPPRTRFIAYQEIPRGATYLPAFNRRCTLRLARMFDEAEQMAAACTALGGTPADSKADAAYQFEFLPDIFVQLLFWEGDDEFPAQAQILFSDNITAFFSSEDVVVISEIILRALAQGYVS